MKTKELIAQSKKNQLLQSQLDSLNQHKYNLQNEYLKLTGSKAFKLWQKLNELKKNPKKIVKLFKVTTNRDYISDSVYNQNLIINQEYSKWFELNKPKQATLLQQKKESLLFKYRPKISIITPVYDPEKEHLEECIESVLAQTYDNWELCIADDKSTKSYIKPLLNKYSHLDKRIKVLFRPKNGHISETSNSALSQTTGEYVALLDHDDILSPDALFEIIKTLNVNKNIDFIYSDEDKLEMTGKHADPFFKPDWSPELLMSMNYICHLSVIKKTLIDLVGGFRKGLEGSQDYDLFLRVTEKTSNISHISKILYSWRKVPNSTAAQYSIKSYANNASIMALTDSLKRRNIKGKVGNGLAVGTFQVSYDIIKPLVSIIIPTKDKLDLLKQCIDSIINLSSYTNYEILIVDTGSQQSDIKKYYSKIKSNRKIKVIKYDKHFNFSEVNNIASETEKGDYLIFLNNDTKVISKDWIQSLLQFAQLKHVGPVGPKLLYPNNKIQHAGIEILNNGWPHHYQINKSDSSYSTFPFPNYKDLIKNPTAVTGACLMISKNKFEKLGKFDVNFPNEFQDVDLSIKARKAGLYPAYTPFASLIHFESQTIKENRSWKRILTKLKELHEKHPDFKSPFSPYSSEFEPELVSVISTIENIKKVTTFSDTNDNVNSKNLLFITHLYSPSIGGAEKLFQNIAERLAVNSNITVLTTNTKSTNDYYKRNQSYELPATKEVLNKVKIIRSNISYSFIPKLFNKFGRSINSLWFNFGPVFFGPFYKTSDIQQLLKQKWDWIVAGPTPTTSLFYGVFFKKITGAKLAIIPCMHTEDSLHTSKASIWALKQADAIFTLTENENEFLMKRGINKNIICTIGVGVDDYLLTNPFQNYSEKEYVLYLGQEGGHKNIPLLIDAMISLWKKGYKNKLIIAGARTDYSNVIDEKINNLNSIYNKNIIRLNNITNEDKVKLLDNCLVMVNPSSYESFGIVFIEAWARKKPVIGADIPAVNKLISNNQDGLLFQDKNVNQLSAKIEDIIKNNKVSQEYGNNGYNKVLKKYTWKKIINSIVSRL